MKRIWKKILIFVLIFSISFSFIDNRKTAYAAGTVGVLGLELILMMLIGYVANQYDVNLPMPDNQEDRYALYKLIFKTENALESIDTSDLFNIDTGATFLEYIGGGGTIANIDFSEWYTYQEIMNINAQDLEIVKDGLLEYYDVPVLANKIDVSYGGMVANVMSALEKWNINITSNFLIETGIFDYKYITIVTTHGTILTTSFTKNLVIGTNTEPKISSTYYSSTYNEADTLWIPNEENKLVFELKYSHTSNIWGVASLNNNHTSRVVYISEYGEDVHISERLIFNNYNLMAGEPDFPAGINRSWRNNIHAGLILNSSLSYITFLASKYGGGALGIKENEEIEVKLGVLGRVIRNVPELVLDIDNVGSTDSTLENLKNIDDFAQENYGENVISPTITDVKPITYPVEYTDILDITSNIDENFNNSLGAVNFTTTDFPDYLLVGLSFVAWVFGQMWLSMGDYTVVLVFSASIALVAILFGLGLKRQKTSDKSDVGTKSSKTKKK